MPAAAPVAFFAYPANLTAKTTQLLALRGAQTVGSTTLVTLGLLDPVADRLRRRLELPCQALRRASCPNQLDHLAPVLRRIGRS